MKHSRVGRVLAAVAIPMALLASLVSWGLSSPVGSSPDDDYHLASIWCGAGLREGLCEEGDNPDERRVPAVLLESSACFAFNPDQSASCEQKPATILVNSNRGNFEASYPPVFYGTLSVFASSDVETSVLLMRSFNALVFVGVASLLFLMLLPGFRGPLIFGVVATIVPLGMFLVPSVNPSSWAITSASALWITVHAFLTTESNRRRLVLGGLAIVLTVGAAGARSDAAVYSALAVVVALLLASREMRNRRWVSIAALPVLLIVIAAISFLTSGQSGVLSPETAPETSRSVADLARSTLANAVLLPQLWAGVFGTWGLGWLDTALPGSVWFSTVVVFAGLMMWGLQRLGRRKAAALILVFLTLVAVPLYVLVKDNLIVGAAVQPRYIYPLIIMAVGIMMWGFIDDRLALNRTQIGLVGALIVIANSIALHVNIRRYVTGIDDQGANLDEGAEWWWTGLPISPMGVWMIGSVVFALAVVGIISYLLRKPSQEAAKSLDSAG